MSTSTATAMTTPLCDCRHRSQQSGARQHGHCSYAEMVSEL